jgi:Cdc6-like AAA superfamily ATPase
LSNDSPVIDFTVSMADINEAAKELFSSNYVDIIVNSTHQEKILLCALLHCQKVLKLSEVPLDRVFQHHQALCRSTGCSVVPEYSSFLNILGNISETRLVTIDSKISYSESKVRKSFTVLYLNTIADDVLFALSQDSTLEMVVSQIRESQ